MIVTGLGIVILAGCHRTADHRTPREKLALAGLDNLREAFNQAACQKIFDEADEVFQVSQTDWLEAYERIRRSLGWWKSFDAHLDHTDGVPLRVVVYGDAEFATAAIAWKRFGILTRDAPSFSRWSCGVGASRYRYLHRFSVYRED